MRNRVHLHHETPGQRPAATPNPPRMNAGGGLVDRYPLTTQQTKEILEFIDENVGLARAHFYLGAAVGFTVGAVTGAVSIFFALY